MTDDRELRTSQNWIGGPGSTIENARFVPPPPDALGDPLTDWERFANDEVELPLLVQDALLHYQFETLHPFLDGNGRLGRLLIVFFLIARDRLLAPLLYLSSYLERVGSATTRRSRLPGRPATSSRGSRCSWRPCRPKPSTQWFEPSGSSAPGALSRRSLILAI